MTLPPKSVLLPFLGPRYLDVQHSDTDEPRNRHPSSTSYLLTVATGLWEKRSPAARRSTRVLDIARQDISRSYLVSRIAGRSTPFFPLNPARRWEGASSFATAVRSPSLSRRKGNELASRCIFGNVGSKRTLAPCNRSPDCCRDRPSSVLSCLPGSCEGLQGDIPTRMPARWKNLAAQVP